MAGSLNALIVSASSDDARDVVEALRGAGLEVAAERTDDPSALPHLGGFDVALVDPATPGVRQGDVERLAGEIGPVVVVSNGIDAERVAGLMRAGAGDVVLRSHLERLPEAVERTLSSTAEGAGGFARGPRFHARLLDEVNAAVCALDLDHRIVFWNRGAEELFGWARDEALGRRESELGLVARDSTLAEKRRTLLTGRKFDRDFIARRRDGTTFPSHARDAPVRDERGEVTGYVCIYEDISERRRAEEQLAFLSEHDPVTGLPNRRLFRVHLDLAARRSQRTRSACAVLLIDLNRFRLVNDSLGHAAGDDLLRQAAWRMREASDVMDIVARHGEDEFLVLIADIPCDENAQAAGRRAAEAVAQRIHRALEQPFKLGGNESFIGATIGISVCPGDARDGETMLRHSTAALAEARRHARPWAIFSGRAPTQDPLALGTRLRGAPERNELELHYQPVVDLRAASASQAPDAALESGIVGVEALLRWNDPQRGTVPPGTFIPLAEETGLIEPIGDWVLDEAMRQMSRWKLDGRVFQVAVNVSPRQLWRPELASRLVEQADAAGIERRRMTVEVTESAAMTDPDRTLEVLRDLREAGFRLAIDDFGRGYSSLARLGQLPADVLKIDRSFVMRIPGDETAAKMVTAIIQLAESLGMTALAEGIETEEQLWFLVERGCRLGQGFLFSKAVPANQLPL